MGTSLNPFGHSPTPSPLQFSNGAPVPGAPGSSNPVGGSLPLAGLPHGMNSQQAAAIQNAVRQNPDLQGVIDTIGGWGSDAWNWITQVLPHGADGSVDWGKIGGDIAGFVKNNAKGLLDAASVVEGALRGQKADALANQAVDLVKGEYADKQPLRDAGMAGMLNPSANAPNLSALKAQGQNGLSLQAPTPPALSLAGVTNAASIASGPQSPNPFAKALPLAGGPSMPQMPSLPGSNAPGGSPPPALPIAAPPRQHEPMVPPVGQGPTIPMPPVSYGNGATTTAVTNTLKNAQGKYSPNALTPNDATALTPYGRVLPLAGG